MTEEKKRAYFEKYAQMKAKINQAMGNYKGEMIKLSDCIADNPELPGQEFEASKKVVSLLREHGYNVEYPFAGSNSAFRGVFGADKHKYCLLYTSPSPRDRQKSRMPSSA